MSYRRDIENLSFLYRPDMDDWQREEWERQRADAEYDMKKNDVISPPSCSDRDQKIEKEHKA